MWESSQPWLSESIVTQPSGKLHAGTDCWRHKRLLQNVSKVRNRSFCEPSQSWWDFATGYQRLAFYIL